MPNYEKMWGELRDCLDLRIINWKNEHKKSIKENRGKDERICFVVGLHLSYLRDKMGDLEKEGIDGK
jgi:hypothetical protein